MTRQKLDGLLRRLSGVAGVLADAMRAPLRDTAVDQAVCVTVAHHLDDVELGQVLIVARRAARNARFLVDELFRIHHDYVLLTGRPR
jgi:hypothetical protein